MEYVVFHAFLCSFPLLHLTVSSQKASTCCRTTQCRETLNANKNLEKNLRNLQQKACCARQITFTSLIAKATKKTTLTNLLAVTSEWLDWRMCPLAKQGEAAILQERGKGAKWHPAGRRNKEERGMHGGIIRLCYTQEPAGPGELQQHWCAAYLKLWKKDYSKVLCLLYSQRTFYSFTLCSLLSVITQWTTGIKISIWGELKGRQWATALFWHGRETSSPKHYPL